LIFKPFLSICFSTLVSSFLTTTLTLMNRVRRDDGEGKRKERKEYMEMRKKEVGRERKKREKREVGNEKGEGKREEKE